jgi:hypothetical protein
MRHLNRLLSLVVGASAVVACDAPRATGPGDSRALGPSLDQVNNGVLASATGGGHYLLLGAIDVQFAFSALQKPDGTGLGQFHQRLEVDGSVVDFRGEVTCMTVDPLTKRAWVGGIVTENRSTDPGFTTPIHQPGKDVWFRVVDYGEGGDSPPDRTSFLGFEGAAGIITSEEYCRAQIWPTGDARTWPVTSGNIQVR